MAAPSVTAARAGQLLRRFNLTPKAKPAELKSAYLKQAKVLHPDIAGKESEDQFRRLQEEYEEAMKILRGEVVPSPTSSPSAGPRGRYSGSTHHGFYNGWTPPPHTDPRWRTEEAYKAPNAEPPEPLTSAQRLRNVVLVAGGVVGATVLFWPFSSAPSRKHPMQEAWEEAPRTAASLAQRDATVAAAAAVGGPALVEGAPLRRSVSRNYEPVSQYYKTRMWTRW